MGEGKRALTEFVIRDVKGELVATAQQEVCDEFSFVAWEWMGLLTSGRDSMTSRPVREMRKAGCSRCC